MTLIEKQRIIHNQIHQNIIAKLQVWLSKLTRVRFASLKKSPHLLRRVVFFGLPLHHCPPTCANQALCFTVYYAVGWLAGGWSPTFTVLHVSTFLTLVVLCRCSPFGSCGLSVLLVSCPFRVAYLFFGISEFKPSRIIIDFSKIKKYSKDRRASLVASHSVFSRSSPSGFCKNLHTSFVG